MAGAVTRPDLQRSSAAFDRSIGISERVAPLQSLWQGILRHRWTDFMVNEIRKDGTVVHLRDCHIGEVKSNEPSAAGKANAPPEKPEIPQEELKRLEDLTSATFVQSLVEIYRSPLVDSNGRTFFPKPALTGQIDDKQKRSQIHQEVRKVFKGEIETTTVDDDCIKATRGKPPRTKHKASKKPQVACSGSGDFIHFTMFKENRDTIEATQVISRLLGLKKSRIHVAGTKDRRAATAQRCSIRIRNVGDLAAINPMLNRIKTGDYERSSKALRLGELLGNEFTLVVKDCRLPDDAGKPASDRARTLKETVATAMDHMYQHGWINYFGHQRFGSFATGTHRVGMLIMSGEYEEAVNRILEYDPAILEAEDIKQHFKNSARYDEYNRALAIRTFKEQRDSTALKQLPSRFAAERAIIGHLGRGPSSAKDYAGALLKVPRTLRTLYLHAYQSFVWNHGASKRWELYGSKVVEGDLVAIETPRPDKDTVDQDGDEVIHAEDLDDVDESAITPHMVTGEEVASGKFTIYDVILPTAGFGTMLPENDVGQFYKDFMAKEENGGMDATDIPRRHKDFTAEGSYRRLMARFLGKPSVDSRIYGDDNEQMCPTDLDLVMEKLKKQDEETDGKRPREDDDAEAQAGQPLKKARTEAQESAAGGAMDVDMCTENTTTEGPNGKAETASGPDAAGAAASGTESNKVALILGFQLGKGAYATVVTRELGLSSDDPSS